MSINQWSINQVSISQDEALLAIEAVLNAQNRRFEAFVDTFRALPVDTRIAVNPCVFEAIEATTHNLAGPINEYLPPLGALRV